MFVRREFPDDRVETVMGDLLDHDSIEKAIDGVDVVFHTASFIFLGIRTVRKNFMKSMLTLIASLLRLVKNIG